jgi:hypothetical protein
MQPYEIIAAPLTAWLSPVGTAYPEVGALPSATWVKVGANGAGSIEDNGITIESSQKIDLLRTLGSMGPVKAFRSEVALKISFTLLDMTVEAWKLALNGNSLSTVAASSGVPGSKSIQLMRTGDVTYYAMLLRGPSPVADEMSADYRFPRVCQFGNPKPLYKKFPPAALLLEFDGIEDPDYANGKFGEYITQTANAT